MSSIQGVITHNCPNKAYCMQPSVSLPIPHIGIDKVVYSMKKTQGYAISKYLVLSSASVCNCTCIELHFPLKSCVRLLVLCIEIGLYQRDQFSDRLLRREGNRMKYPAVEKNCAFCCIERHKLS